MRIPPNIHLLSRFANQCEGWPDIIARVSALLPTDDDLHHHLADGDLLPAGQILRGANVPGKVLFNSGVLSVEPNEQPAELANRITRWTELGVGMGVNLGPLMDWYAGSMVEPVLAIGRSQQRLWEKGIRRTATMVLFPLGSGDLNNVSIALGQHPELRHLNMAVTVSDASVQDFNVKGRPASSQLALLLEAALNNGNPGFVFPDRIKSSADGGIVACNACAEAYLEPEEAIPLASINLAAATASGTLDEACLKSSTAACVRLLDRTIDASAYPSKKCRSIVTKHRRIGLGVVGFDTALKNLGLPFCSDAAVTLSSELAARIKKTAFEQAAMLDAARGPGFHRGSLLAIAPTGGISALWGISSGIEPTLASSLQTEFSSIDVKIDSRPTPAPHDIHWTWHLRHLAAWQAWIDGGISKTINVPAGIDATEAGSLLVEAWKANVKAISLFRHTSRAPAMRAA